jgi:hypothetical protein
MTPEQKTKIIDEWTMEYSMEYSVHRDGGVLYGRIVFNGMLHHTKPVRGHMPALDAAYRLTHALVWVYVQHI